MALALFSSEVATWLQDGWGDPPDWPVKTDIGWFPGSVTFLHTQPDRAIGLALQPGGGLGNEGATLTVPVLIGTRGDQRDPSDGEDLAWAVWALCNDPAAWTDPQRKLIGNGLTIVSIETPATPALTLVDGVNAAQRVEHTATYVFIVGTA